MSISIRQWDCKLLLFRSNIATEFWTTSRIPMLDLVYLCNSDDNATKVCFKKNFLSTAHQNMQAIFHVDATALARKTSLRFKTFYANSSDATTTTLISNDFYTEPPENRRRLFHTISLFVGCHRPLFRADRQETLINIFLSRIVIYVMWELRC